MPACAGMTADGDAMTSPRAFAHVDTWVFDLDNTLYPHHVNLWQQVDARITEFVSNWLNLTAVEARLGFATHFDGVFDIIAADFEPKPAPQTYRKFLADHAVDPTRAAMFEDLARNLTVPHELGMTTVLVVPDGTKEVVREDWEL